MYRRTGKQEDTGRQVDRKTGGHKQAGGQVKEDTSLQKDRQT